MTDDITPTQKTWKGSGSATESGRSPEEKLAMESKKKERLETYSSQRVTSVLAGEVIVPHTDVSKPETSESSSHASHEMSSGTEEVRSISCKPTFAKLILQRPVLSKIAELRAKLRAALSRQKERRRARYARSTHAAIDDGTGVDSGNVGAQICESCGRACSVKASDDEDPMDSKIRS